MPIIPVHRGFFAPPSSVCIRGGTVDLHSNQENPLVFSRFGAAPVERTPYSNKALRTYSSKAAGTKLYVAFV